MISNEQGMAGDRRLLLLAAAKLKLAWMWRENGAVLHALQDFTCASDDLPADLQLELIQFQADNALPSKFGLRSVCPGYIWRSLALSLHVLIRGALRVANLFYSC